MSLGLIMTFRMLGLFMILPIFAVAAEHLTGASPTLIGLALGIYGLTQGLLQIPFGLISDKIGRKPVIIFGLLIFALGSIIAGISDSIYSMILGRALQGAGAIGSTILATVADLTQSESRAKAMAFIGLNIGFAFILAMIIGPAINAAYGLSAIFWLTAALAFIGILMTFIVIPKPLKLSHHPEVEAEPKRFADLLKDTQLLRLDFGIFTLHATLTALFLAVPIILSKSLQLSNERQVVFYTSILILSFCLSLPFIVLAEKRKKIKPVFLMAILALGFSIFGIAFFSMSFVLLSALLLIFFTAFTLLEASLPSLISKIAPSQKRGTAMGIYSSSQFFGIFIGGSAGGIIFSHFGLRGVLFSAFILIIIWFLFAARMKKPS
jgi:MFS family permease